MAQITLHRVGELLRIVFELLWDKPDGLPAKDIFALIPELTQLTEYELGFSSLSNTPRYGRIIRLATVHLRRVDWLVKNNKRRWYITEDGRQARKKFTNAEKIRGHIDIVAHVDPIGAKGPRILVQVKHKGQVITAEGLKTFLSALGQNDFGLLVSTGGFTGDAKEELRTGAFQKVTALDLETFFNLWMSHYDKLSQGCSKLNSFKANIFSILLRIVKPVPCFNS